MRQRARASGLPESLTVTLGSHAGIDIGASARGKPESQKERACAQGPFCLARIN